MFCKTFLGKYYSNTRNIDVKKGGPTSNQYFQEKVPD